MNRVEVDGRWRVRLLHRRLLPMSVEDSWRELRDFQRFSCLDHFHRQVVIEGPIAEGTRIRIQHSYAGVAFWRVGRILRWVEGRRWAFSDLSVRDSAARGFPHVFDVRIEAQEPGTSLLELRVAGRWTARFLPRRLVRCWLAWNLSQIGASYDWALFRRALELARVGSNLPQGTAAAEDRPGRMSAAAVPNSFDCGRRRGTASPPSPICESGWGVVRAIERAQPIGFTGCAPKRPRSAG